MKEQKTNKVIISSILLMSMLLFSTLLKAQSCNPSYSGAECEGSIVSFFANALGYDTYEWDFGDTQKSTVRDPKHAYEKAGDYIVTLVAKDGTGILNDCTSKITIKVKESPKIKIALLNSKDQCFKGNEFCFNDSSTAADNSEIIRETHVWSDGAIYETINPTYPRKFCHTIEDARGGYFHLTIELEDKNGCVTKKKFENIVRVWPRLGLELRSNSPIGCDSTLATLTNQTYINWLQNPETTIGLKDIAEFRIEFGDDPSTTIVGDSITNTEWWTGPKLNGKIEHMYRSNGVFNATLYVKSKYGCEETFEFKSAATNFKYKPVILADKDSSCTSDPIVNFRLKDGPIQGASYFEWNFGDPPSGPDNSDDKSWTPSHSYGGGPWMISLNVIVGPCDLMVYDTIFKIGPTSQIEKTGVRILEREKYQCEIRDTVHMTNVSSFYHSDDIVDDEDVIKYINVDSILLTNDTTIKICMDSLYSVITDSVVGSPGNTRVWLDSTLKCGVPRNPGTQEPQIEYWEKNPATNTFVDIKIGETFYTQSIVKSTRVCRDSTTKAGNYFVTKKKKEFLFNHDPIARTGNQVALLKAPRMRLKDNVTRLWTLGDNYAPRCTTDVRINKNVGINCNFSRDTLPSHWYTPWDEIYQQRNRGQFYRRSYPKTIFSKNARSCTQVSVYPSDTIIVPQEVFVVAPIESNYKLNVLYNDSITGEQKVDKVIINANTQYPESQWRKNYRLKIHRPNLVINGPIIHTVYKEDEEFNIPAGVSVKVTELGKTAGTIHVGPKNLVIKTGFEYELEEGDSMFSLFQSETTDADTILAAASTYTVDSVINGIDSFVQVSKVFIDPAYHRNYFYQNIASCQTVVLTHKDTVHPFACESTNTQSLALLPPNARGMKWTSGTPCVVAPGEPFNPAKYLTFSLSETKPGCTQQWFEVNYDSLSGKDNFFSYKTGRILAPTAPGDPAPFTSDYSDVGTWGTSFVKSYSANEVDNDERKALKGSFTLGLLIGNGPPQFDKNCNPIAPECVDTAWYNDMFRIKYMDPSFEMIFPYQRDWMCAGDTAYLRINNPVQEDISTLGVYWSSFDGKETQSGRYFEQFVYFDDYKGPQANRNDKNVNWNGETDWKYNYVIRFTNSYSLSGGKIATKTNSDTVVTKIFRDYATAVNTYTSDKVLESEFKNIGLDLRDIKPEDVPAYLGDPTNPSCIDTTGLSQYIDMYLTSISTDTVHHGSFVYQYNSNKSDSSIVEEILHFRDSSLKGFHTMTAKQDFMTMDSVYYKKGDKVDGLHQMVYQYPVIKEDPCDPNKSTLAFENVRGVVNTVVFIENTDGCQTSNGFNLKVGFFHDKKFVEKAVCMGSTHVLKDSIRYWTTNPLVKTYPVDPDVYWEDPVRFAKREIKEVDWDLADGKDNFEKSIVFTHVYNKPGRYTIRMAMQDSNNCRDTAELEAFVTGIKANFELPAPNPACNNIMSFYDSTEVFDPCSMADTCDNKGTVCDSIVRWEWDFGDGSRTSLLKNPSHDYTSNGWFTVKMKVWSLLGCEDSISKQIYIAGPKPGLEFADYNPAWGPDTFKVCIGDPISVVNKSQEPVFNPTWEIRWGDSTTGSTFTTLTGKASHTYKKTGTYYIELDMEDEIEGTSIKCKRTYPDTSTADGKIPRKIVVIVRPVAPAGIEIDDSVVCIDELIQFTSNSDELYTRYVWNFGDGDTITRNHPDVTIAKAYDQAGVYNVTLVPDFDLPVGDFGPKCVDTARAKVTITDVQADFEIENQEQPNFCFKNKSVNAVEYKWLFQKEEGLDEYDESFDENPCYNWGERRGEFEVCLEVVSPEGCRDTTCQKLENNLRLGITPYNVFTPDKEGDDYNKHFVVEVEGHEEYEIKIYNRWGELVFESADPSYSWDGRIMNKGADCPEGTYFYVINYKIKTRPKNDDLGPISGTVTLIRD